IANIIWDSFTNDIKQKYQFTSAIYSEYRQKHPVLSNNSSFSGKDSPYVVPELKIPGKTLARNLLNYFRYYVPAHKAYVKLDKTSNNIKEKKSKKSREKRNFVGGKHHLVNPSTMSFASLVSCILFYDATTYTPADFHHLYELKGHTYKIGNLTNAV
ncbi:37751_t:CDS:2, partial [Gigaspora margarita]